MTADFKLLPNPLEYVSGYYMDVYCKYQNPDHDYDEFAHSAESCETHHEAVTQLRARGWRIHNDRTATCPKCMARLKALGVK